jgi:hypothetical protein
MEIAARQGREALSKDDVLKPSGVLFLHAQGAVRLNCLIKPVGMKKG